MVQSFSIVNVQSNPDKYQLMISLMEGGDLMTDRKHVTFQFLDYTNASNEIKVYLTALERQNIRDEEWHFKGYYFSFPSTTHLVEGEYSLLTKTGSIRFIN